jgi:hypothetical protein
VIDAPTTMRGLTVDEFAAFHLTPEEGVKVAIANIKRVYGPPIASVWTDGVMTVEGKSAALNKQLFSRSRFLGRAVETVSGWNCRCGPKARRASLPSEV